MKYFIFLSAFFLLLIPSVAFAHVLKTDRTIGAVMHIDPNDAPVAAQPASFYFDLTDTTSHFSLAACNCSVVISENGKQLFSTALSRISANAGSFVYTFPQADAYTVELLGVPTTPDAFQAFTLNYIVRVTGAGAAPSKTSNVATLFIGLVIVGAAIALFFAFRPSKRA